MYEKHLYQAIRAEGSTEEIEHKGPFECTRTDAWLGSGFYYWETFKEHAHWWGQQSLKNNYIICETHLCINRIQLYDLEDSEVIQEFEQINKELIKKYPNQKLTVSFIIKYLHTKGLLNEYSAIRARFNGSIRKNTTDINGEIMTPKMTPNSKAKAYIDLKPQIQLCLLNKSIIGEKNYKVIYSSQYEGYI